MISRVQHLIVVCERCKETFLSTSSLNRHKRNFHGEICKKFRCECCKKIFSCVSSLNRHKRKVHGEICKKFPKSTLECPYEGCKRTFSCASTLNRHKRNDHGKTYKKFQKSRLKCPVDECCSDFERYQPLREHLDTVHGYDNSCEEFYFDSEEDYELWQYQMQSDTCSEYIKRRKSKVLADGSISTHLCCSRSYEYKPSRKGQGVRAMKYKGSRKIGEICPSTMEVTRRVLENGINQIKVKFWNNHYGHTCDLEHLSLPERDKLEIARKLKNGETFHEILEAIRGADNENTQWSKRTRLLRRKDLHNIIRQYKLSAPSIQDDRLSVKMWVAEMEKRLEGNPVLLYKEQGQQSFHFEINDFALAIMSESSQKEQQISSKLCIDSIHGTNACDILLHTLLTIDEFGYGVPVAYFLCNKSDESAFRIFFEHVKEKFGQINCSIFMSDDADALYRAWTAVMGPVENHLLCSWHVDWCWRKNFAKIQGKNGEKKKQVYETLRTLMTMNEDGFKSLLSKSTAMWLDDDDTRIFGEYFVKTYASRPESWANVYQRYLGIDANHLESIHKSLKNIYLEGKWSKQIVKTIHALMRFRPVQDCVLNIPNKINQLSSDSVWVPNVTLILDESSDSCEADATSVSETIDLCEEEEEEPTESQEPSLVPDNLSLEPLLGTVDPAKERLKQKLKLAMDLFERESENVLGQKSSTIEKSLDTILEQLKK